MTLDYRQDEVHLWRNGDELSDCVTGMIGPKQYKVFRTDRALEDAGAKRTPGVAAVAYSWEDHVNSKYAAYDTSHT